MIKRIFLSKRFWQTFLSALGAMLFLAAAFLGGYYYHASQDKLTDMTVLREAYSLLFQQSYQEPPALKQMEYGMINGLVAAYHDPYAMFYEPAQHELTTYQLEGFYGDIGVIIIKDDDGFWTLFPYPQGPAYMAGVRDKDRLFAVDRIEVTPDTPLDHIKAAIFGPAEESVQLEVGRPPDYLPLNFKIMRGEYTIPSVNQRIDPDEGRLGILTISLIGSHTAEEVTQAIENLQAEGATHFVLDLRSNPGGYLNAGVDLSRLFLAQGDILMERDRQRKVKSHHVEQPGPFTDFPLAVLIGQNTASSAEVLAGALQVNQRAILVGTNSFGKDTIQHVFVLKDGSSLSMTAAHWWVPGLEDSFAGQGLVPDLPAPEFDDPNQTDPALAAVKAYFFP